MNKPFSDLFHQAREQICRDEALTERLLRGTRLPTPSLLNRLARRGLLLLTLLLVLATGVALLGMLGAHLTGGITSLQPGKASAGFSGLSSVSDPALFKDVSGEALALPVFETNAFSFPGMALRTVIPFVFWMLPVLWLYLMAILDLPEDRQPLKKEQHA
jgi:hypothetical protein